MIIKPAKTRSDRMWMKVKTEVGQNENTTPFLLLFPFVCVDVKLAWIKQVVKV